MAQLALYWRSTASVWRKIWHKALLVFAVTFAIASYLGIKNDEVFPAIVYVAFTLAAFSVANIGARLQGDPDGVISTPPLENQEAARALLSQLSPSERMTTILEEWKHVTNVQMHFNEMIIRMRTLAVSVVITVFGAAGFAIAAHRDQFVRVFERDIHASAFVVTFGLVLWLTIFIIDYWYYYKLLLGSVRRGYEIDAAFWNSNILGTMRLFGSAMLISAAIGPRGFSEWPLRFFYGIIYFAGLAFLIAILIVIDPIQLSGGIR